MIRKLRRKFVITAMTALTIILVTLIAVINIANVMRFTKASDQLLSMLADNGGAFPEFPQPDPADSGSDAFPFDPASSREMEIPFSTRYFWVAVQSDGSIQEIDISHIAAVSYDQAGELAQSVKESGRTRGFAAGIYRFLVHDEEDGGWLILFNDCSEDLLGATSLLRNSILLMLICLGFMFLLVYALSGRAVAPAVESMEKQKQFITDAGHELKTPLAVISADVDVLELEYGKSDWTDSIRKQCRRMTELVQNLLTLSRMEEETGRVVFSDLDLTAVLRETADGFRTAAEAEGKSYQTQIWENVHIKGDAASMKQLLSILIDNALRYSDKDGNIVVRLSCDRQVVIEVSNTCEKLPEGDLNRLFDRFYRADSSRNRRTGGYGIGLSAARAIAEQHGGTIAASSDGEHSIRFIVRMPKSAQTDTQT